MDETIEFTVNGKQRTVTVDSARPLLEVLRENLDLTGPKYVCGEGQCGACTVLMDGTPVRSCVTPVSLGAGTDVVTIEGLADGDELHPVQQAFLSEWSFQCGFCTSGMIMSTVALLRKTPDPTDEQIRSALSGNICRCCGYDKILRTVRRAAHLSARSAVPAGNAGGEGGAIS